MNRDELEKEISDKYSFFDIKNGASLIHWDHVGDIIDLIQSNTESEKIEKALNEVSRLITHFELRNEMVDTSYAEADEVINDLTGIKSILEGSTND